MNSIAPYVERIAEATHGIQAAKTAIASAITAKGGTVGASDGLEDFAAAIAAIPSGGGAHEVTIMSACTNAKQCLDAIFGGVTLEPNSVYTAGWGGFATGAEPATDQYGYCVFSTNANGAAISAAATYARYRSGSWAGVGSTASNYDATVAVGDKYYWIKVV